MDVDANGRLNVEHLEQLILEDIKNGKCDVSPSLLVIIRMYSCIMHVILKNARDKKFKINFIDHLAIFTPLHLKTVSGPSTAAWMVLGAK